MDDLNAKIVEILHENISMFPEDTSSDLIAEGIIDSLCMINLVTAFEDEFLIEMDGDDITKDNFTSVDTMTALVKKYLDK